MELQLDPQELEDLAEFLRHGSGRIAAAVVPGPLAGDALLGGLKRLLEGERFTVATEGDPPALGDAARRAGAAGEILVLPLDGRRRFPSEAAEKDFWRQLNYQREHLVAEDARTLLLLDDRADRHLALIADDLREWVRVYRFPEAFLQNAAEHRLLDIDWSDGAQEVDRSTELPALRSQLARARELGFSEAEIASSYAGPLFVALVRAGELSQAQQIWQNELRRGDGLEALRGSSLAIWRAGLRLAAKVGAWEEYQELSRRYLDGVNPDRRAHYLDAVGIRAHALDRMGRYKDARELVGQAISSQRQRPPNDRAEVESLAKLYVQLGQLLFHSDLLQAMQYFRKALDLFQQTANDHRIAQVYILLSEAHWSQGQWEKAEAMLGHGLEISERLGRQEEMAIAYGALGFIYYWYRGDLQQAEQMLGRSLVIAERIGDQALIERGKRLLADLRSPATGTE